MSSVVVFPKTQSNSFKANLRLCAIISSSCRLSLVSASLRCLVDFISAACCRLDDKKSGSFELILNFKSFSVFTNI